MACYGLYKDRYIIQTRTLPTHPWESLVELCQDFYEATAVKGNKQLIVCFSCTGSKFKLDYSTAKSATVICAVGITFGLGGYILYKLYCRFIQPLLKKPPKKKKPAEIRDETKEKQDINGIDTSMGNSSSNKPETSAYFSPVTGVALHVGRKSRSKDNLKLQSESSRVRQRKRTKRRKTSENELIKSAPIKVPSSGSDLSINHLIHSETDVSNVDIDGSLKANVSLQSLTDRHMREVQSYSQAHSSGLVNSFPVSDAAILRSLDDNCDEIHINVDDLSNKENCDIQTAGRKYHIELSDDLLTVSSVLMTPPSEEDTGIHPNHSIPGNPLVLQDTSNFMQHPRSSYSSDYNTDSKKSYVDDCHVSAGDESCSCDEKDSVSSLPKLRSPDRFFRESLLHRLQECHNGAGSSNSSSLDSSPEFSPYARNRNYSIDGDNLSGLATPDSEIFSSYSEVGRSTEVQFEHLEEEVLDIEEEFASLTNKLNQLKNIAVNSDGSSLEYSPSHPLSKKAVEIVDRTRSRLSRSRSVSVSSNDSSPAYSFDMPDLSWDSEGLQGDNSNKSTPSSRRCSEPGNSLRNKLHTKFVSKSTNGQNGISFESPMETDIEKDGTLDNLSTDECFDIGSHSDWTKDSSSENNLKKSDCSSSVKESVATDSNPHSVQMSEASSSSLYESARDSSPDHVRNGHVVDIGTINGGHLNTSGHNGLTTTKSNNVSGSTQVEEKIDIAKYVQQEWKGQTEKAITIKKAYREIPKITGCLHLCRIRGDNYCGLRGTLFQCLCNSIDLSKRWPNLNMITDKLTKRYSESNSGLKHWTFAGRLPCKEDQRLTLMSDCLSFLYSKFEEANCIESQSDREHWTCNLLNSEATCDLYLMEGLKLLMYLNILDLNDQRGSGEDIPIFVWLLFARDTSETPLMFVKNHLNTLGDSGGIEQIEMYLLGHTLGVRIQVLRLSQFGQEDFTAYYPDDADNNWSQISLIAEDDRHYNVPVP